MKKGGSSNERKPLPGKGSKYEIVLKNENCDNLIRQTVEFLEVVKGLKREGRLDIQISIQDVKESCCIHKGQVVWGYSEIVKLLMTPTTVQYQPQSTQYKQYGNKSDFNEDSMMKSDFIQSMPESTEVDTFQRDILNQGDHDDKDRLDEPNPTMSKGSPTQQNQQKVSFNNPTQAQNPPKIKKADPFNQLALDNEYHSRFLDEMKSGSASGDD